MTMIKNELLLPTVTVESHGCNAEREGSQTQERTLLKDSIYG